MDIDSFMAVVASLKKHGSPKVAERYFSDKDKTAN